MVHSTLGTRALQSATLVLLLVAVAVLALAGRADAVHLTGKFELDGNTVPLNAAPPIGPAEDFDNVYLGTDTAYDHKFIDDSAQPDSSVHDGNKDEQPIADWKCKVKINVTNKLDLMHTYYAAYDVAGETVAYVGSDRDTVEGNANMGVWLFQSLVTCDPATGVFTGNKTDGDLLVVVPFTGGGAIPNVDVYRWTDPTPAAPESGDETLVLLTSGADCAALVGDANICGSANGAPINSAWRSPIPTNGFVEVGMNISQLQPDTCYRSLMVESRSSQEITADLEDFTLAQIFTCATISVEKVSDPSGDPTSFDFALAGPAPFVTELFSLEDGQSSHITVNLLPGSYSVTETVPANWSLAAACRGGSFGGGAAYTNGAPFTVNVGDKVVCTFVNTTVPPPVDTTITVDKVTIPPPDPLDPNPPRFSFTISNGAPVASFDLADPDPSVTTSVAAGTYTLTEAPLAGWELSGVLCTGGPFGAGGAFTNGGTITLAAGDKVVCTFTNVITTTPTGTSLTVEKVVIGGTAGPFTFNVNGPNLVAVIALNDGESQTFAPIDAGDYTITETPIAGFNVLAFCSGGPFPAGGGPYVPGDSIAIANGQQVACTFVNIACPEDRSLLRIATRTVDLSRPEGGALPNHHTVGSAYAAAASGETIAMYSRTTENAVLGDGKSLTITQCTNAGITAANTALPAWDITTTGKLTIIGPDSVGGTIGWHIATSGHDIRGIRASGASQIGVLAAGNSNAIAFNSISASPVGLRVQGQSNDVRGGTVSDNGTGVEITAAAASNVFRTATVRNNVTGIIVQGTGNIVRDNRVDVNTGTGIAVTGAANTVRDNRVSQNTANGIAVTGASNTILANLVEANKGDGIQVAATGTTIDGNSASKNQGDGFDIRGGTAASANKLKNNQSNTGGAGTSSENVQAEYRLLNTVTNLGSNKADSIVVPKTTVPKKCDLFPATGVTKTFAAAYICE
jgi:parallel beta-helix repeat protein